jgi:hypothetical protein
VIVDLVDAMRCTRAHEPTALITSVDRLTGRGIVTGSLGCPVCDARYPVVDGVAVFDPAWYARCRAAPATPRAEDADVIRVAALLDLTDPTGLVLLEGATAVVGPSLHALLGTALVLLNPLGPVSADGELSVVYGPVAPFAPGTLRGAALGSTPEASVVDSVTAALRPGGRIMAPVSLAVPAGVTELARDAHGWVGARRAESSTTPVSLSRGPRQGSA